MRTEIVGAQQFYLAYGGEDASGAQLAVGCRSTTGAGLFSLIGAGRIALQQPAQGHGTDLMQRGSHGHLHGFQIQLAAFATLLKNQMQQSAYFAGDFLLDRFGRFFSC